jgi:hypothetical protein
MGANHVRRHRKRVPPDPDDDGVQLVDELDVERWGHDAPEPSPHDLDDEPWHTAYAHLTGREQRRSHRGRLVQ